MFLTEAKLVPTYAKPRMGSDAAWDALSAASTDLGDFVDSSTAGFNARREAYDRQIAEIHERTGVQLKNPYYETDRVLEERLQESFGNRTYPRRDTDLNDFNSDIILVERQAAFDRQLAELAPKFPDHADLFRPEKGRDYGQVSRDVQAAFDRAMANDELGLAGRVSAVLWGGGKAMLRDPLQLGLLTVGAGPGAGRTIASRIGQVMVREALVSSGGEVALQAISQNYRKSVGLEYGLADAAMNVGMAGAFGAAFGGAFGAGAEIARALKGDDGVTAAVERVVDGKAIEGDVEAIADHLGVELTADQKSLISRSFEEDVLDNAMVPVDVKNGNQERRAVFEAAMRYADDPDNNPPPEEVERMLADQQAGRLFSDVPEPDDIPFDPVADVPIMARVDDPDALIADAAPDLPDAEFLAPNEPKDFRDVVPMERVDGTTKYVSPKEAYRLADEGNDMADILEACKV